MAKRHNPIHNLGHFAHAKGAKAPPGKAPTARALPNQTKSLTGKMKHGTKMKALKKVKNGY